MNDNYRLENLAAELTEAAYSIALRRGAVDGWLDLELELWEALKATIHQWDEEWPQAGVTILAFDSEVRRSSPVRESG